MRKKAAMLLVLAMIFFAGNAFAEGLLCVNTDAFAALLTYDGEAVIEPGAYDEIFCVIPGRAYAAGRLVDGVSEYVLCDPQGNILSEESVGMLDANHDAVLFRQNMQYGAMNAAGEILIPAQYTQLTANGSGGYLALATDPLDDQADEILCINAAGEVLQSGMYTGEGLKPVSDDRMAFRSPDTEKYGYLNGNGKIVIDAEFSYAGDFANNKAIAAQDGLFGVLSLDGEWLIPPKYAYIEQSDHVILGLLGEETCIAWKAVNCAELFRRDGENLNVSLIGDRILIMDDESIDLVDSEGNRIMEASRSAVLTAGAGDQLVFSDGDWGTACVSIVTAKGEMLARKDQHLLPLDDGMYAFMTMNVAAYNSRDLGEIRYSCDYDSIRYGLLDSEGSEILPAEYLNISCVGAGRYLTEAYDGFRIVDSEGEVIWSRLDESMR